MRTPTGDRPRADSLRTLRDGPRLATASRLATPRLLLPLAIILAAAVLTAALVALSDDPDPAGAPGVTPLRVTAGSEIATGFAVERDRVVTVAHVVDGAVREGGTNAVRVSGVRARVLRVDRRSDLALLAVRGVGGGPPAVTEAAAGDDVRLVRLRDGRSSSQSVRVRRAIVAHVRAAGAERAATRPALELAAARRAATRPALELAARIRAGDSGAPVVSRSGAVAGVVFAASSRREGTAYAVDASALTRLIARE